MVLIHRFISYLKKCIYFDLSYARIGKNTIICMSSWSYLRDIMTVFTELKILNFHKMESEGSEW